MYVHTYLLCACVFGRGLRNHVCVSALYIPTLCVYVSAVSALYIPTLCVYVSAFGESRGPYEALRKLREICPPRELFTPLELSIIRRE
jgi:hypothetical protein